MENNDHNWQDDADAAIMRALSLYIGQGKNYKTSVIADLTRIKERTLRSYLSGEVSIPGKALLEIMRVLPPSFSNMVLERAGLCEARRIDCGESQSPHQVLTNLLKQSSDLSGMLEDGRLDHVEKRKLTKQLPELISALSQYQSKLSGEL